MLITKLHGQQTFQGAKARSSKLVVYDTPSIYGINDFGENALSLSQVESLKKHAQSIITDNDLIEVHIGGINKECDLFDIFKRQDITVSTLINGCKIKLQTTNKALLDGKLLNPFDLVKTQLAKAKRNSQLLNRII